MTNDENNIIIQTMKILTHDFSSYMLETKASLMLVFCSPSVSKSTTPTLWQSLLEIKIKHTQ